MPAAGFNADERAQKREQGPVTLGGTTYHPRRLTNKRLRQIRTVARDSTRRAREAALASSEYSEEAQVARAEGVEDAEVDRRALRAGLGCDEAEDINSQSLCEQLPELLVDDNQQPITAERVRELLDEHLDARDVGDLMTYLLGGPEEDPTPA